MRHSDALVTYWSRQAVATKMLNEKNVSIEKRDGNTWEVGVGWGTVSKLGDRQYG